MFFSLLLCSCKHNKSNENGVVIKENLTEHKDSNNTDKQSVYNKDNFKDTKKIFSFFGESYLGNKKTLLINDIFYTAAFLPKDYYIKKYLKEKDSIDFYREKLKNEQVIQFDFQSLDKKDLLEQRSNGNYKAYVEYLSFKIKNDFYAITNKGDTIPATGVLFERTFKLSPYKRILLYFDIPEDEKKVKLLYYDNLFGNQIIKFNIEV